MQQTQDQSDKWPPSNRNAGRNEIGMTGRLQIGIDGRLHRNTHIAPGLRGFLYRNRCIYYRSYSDRIVVLRVKHGAEDIKPQDFE